MNLFNHQLSLNIVNKRALKVITGLNNFNIDYILKTVKAAEIGGATYVDIAANANIVYFIKSMTILPICVSSIDVIELYKCSLAGADIIEIGNFDIFYSKQILFSAKQILFLAKEVKNIIKNKIICITIPHYLLLIDQIKLALDLQELGIHLVQTEGVSTKNISNEECKSNYILNCTNQASSALSSTYTLSDYIQMPVISASSLNLFSSPIAIYYGASGVGIGSALKNYNKIYDISNYIYSIVCSISTQADDMLKYEKWDITLLSIVKSPINYSILI